MPHSAESFLRELYTLDPSLRARDQELQQTVALLLAQRPHITPNELFIEQLHTKIMEQPIKNPSTTSFRWMPLLAIPALAAIALVVYPYLTPSTATKTDDAVTVTQARGQAFGVLTSQNVTNSRSSATPSATKDMSATPVNGEVESGSGTSALPMDLSYAMAVYTYGGTITIPHLDVLKRNKTLGGLPSADGASVSLLDLGSFSGLRTDQMTWSQRTADGYTITVDGREGTINIYRDSGMVRALSDVASPDGTVSSGSASTATVTDTQAIRIAGSFLTKHGISTESYGAAVVQQSLGGVYMEKVAAGDGAGNSMATVTYPWVVKGTSVYDESGNPFGLQVTVDAATQSVLSVYNLMTRSFTSSQYTLTDQTADIQAFLGRGGWLWSGAVSAETKTTSYALETPSAVYMMSQYQQDGGHDDLLVPALRFPVNEKDQAAVGRSAVMVPVVKNLLTPPTTSTGATVTEPNIAPTPKPTE